MVAGLVVASCLAFALPAHAAYHFSDFRGRPPVHIYGGARTSPVGMSPDQIKAVYHLPARGGRGTIAIIGAYNDATLEKDLAVFDARFGLRACTSANGCLERHAMSGHLKSNSGWATETSLDVQWAHAIAPDAKILLVEATTPSGANLLNAVDYAAHRSDVVAISMSWGGAEFPEEVSLDSHFISTSGARFFASSGDDGAGTSWPASSPNVTGVGGTTVTLRADGSFSKETAWTGSGGGISAYEQQPQYQAGYSISHSNHMRAVPDVAYDADPHTGFPVVRAGKWYTVGGTSAGAPQWAAIATLGTGAGNPQFYADKSAAGHAAFFRDITAGSNGTCVFFCDARTHYDYVTGLGTPLTVNF